LDDDNEPTNNFELTDENIDLTDNMDTTRMDFTGGMAMAENNMPDEVFGGDGMMEHDEHGRDSQQLERKEGSGNGLNDKDVLSLNNNGSLVDGDNDN